MDALNVRLLEGALGSYGFQLMYRISRRSRRVRCSKSALCTRNTPCIILHVTCHLQFGMKFGEKGWPHGTNAMLEQSCEEMGAGVMKRTPKQKLVLIRYGPRDEEGKRAAAG